MATFDESELQDVHPSVWQQIVRGGAAVERGYEKVAQPLAKGLGTGLGVAERQGLLGPIGMALPHAVSPQTQGELIVPQSIPAAVGQAVSGGLAGGAERAGMGMLGRMATSRLGRTALTVGAMGTSAALTGGEPGSAAVSGLAAMIPGETASWAGGKIATKAAGGMEDVAAGDTASRLSGWLKKNMPWMGAHKTPLDLQNTFINDMGRDVAGPRYGEARQRVLQEVQDWGAKRGMMARRTPAGMVGPRIFSVPDFTDELHPKTAFVDFESADELIHTLNQRGYNVLNGMERSSIGGEDFRKASRELRASLARQLEHVKPGLGQDWVRARNEYGQYEAIHNLLRDAGIGGSVEGIYQPDFIGKIKSGKHIDDLNHAFGKDKVADLMNTLQRESKGVKTDIPGEAGGMHGYATAGPHGGHFAVHPKLGKGYQMAGRGPSFTHPSGRIIDPAMIAVEQHAAGQPLRTTEPYTDNPSPYSQEKDRLNAEQFVGTKNPERIETVAKLQDKVRKDKQPRVEHELRTGRLSMPALKRMLSGMTEQNAQMTLKRLTPVDAAHLYALADPFNKIWLTPIIEDKLQALIQSGKLPPDIAEELMHGRIEA